MKDNFFNHAYYSPEYLFDDVVHKSKDVDDSSYNYARRSGALLSRMVNCTYTQRTAQASNNEIYIDIS